MCIKNGKYVKCEKEEEFEMVREILNTKYEKVVRTSACATTAHRYIRKKTLMHAKSPNAKHTYTDRHTHSRPFRFSAGDECRR